MSTNMIKNSFLILSFLCLADGRGRHDPLRELRMMKRNNLHLNDVDRDNRVSREVSPIHVANQEGRKEADRIVKLPGQSPAVDFNQYSGYVTVDPNAGRSLFYYFTEGADPTNKPLVLWLSGGPGCSSVGGRAMLELGPFQVNPDGKTLKYNQYGWNKVSNVLFLDSPAGVGFSYSNTSSDYVTGDNQTAADTYTFLLNWFERFPEYKKRDFFLAGRSYAGHYVPQLADLILQKNNNTKHTVIKLKGIAIGNAEIDFKDRWAGMYDYLWTHAIISDETHRAIVNHCDFSSIATVSDACYNYTYRAATEWGDIEAYDIYAPLCGSNATSPLGSSFDPCSFYYVFAYLNTPEVQEALHANVTGSLPGPWLDCSDSVCNNWTDAPDTVLPVIKRLMGSGISIWIYSGDVDGMNTVTSAKYSMPKLGGASSSSVITHWYPWYHERQVAGYAVGYEKVTFATVRGGGSFVPGSQPERALTLFESFLKGELPPRHESTP